MTAGHQLAVNVLHPPGCVPCQESELSTEGHGLCTCWVVSEHLATYAQRRAWHTEHINDIIANAVGYVGGATE